MDTAERKDHWNHVYETKELKDVSWFQPKPETSLDFIHEFHIPKSAKIIDVGGGDSLLVDHLLDLAYEDLTNLRYFRKSNSKSKKTIRKSGRKSKVDCSQTLSNSIQQKNMTFGTTVQLFIS